MTRRAGRNSARVIAASLPAPRSARLRELLASAGRRRITLVYGARSETENQAVVLREALQAIASEA